MPLIHGGIQENGRRGGTENVPGIVGLGKAAELARQELPEKIVHMRNLRDRLVESILGKVEKVIFTGHPEKRLPGHASFCFEAIEGEALIFMLQYRLCLCFQSTENLTCPGRHRDRGSPCPGIHRLYIGQKQHR
jgi:cysteine sulfinate desulfinase/cysteine desulfurase-like protein